MAPQVTSSLVLENGIHVDGAIILRYEDPRGIHTIEFLKFWKCIVEDQKAKNHGDGWFSDIQDVMQAGFKK